jgi:PAS domain S-box-containing protein
MKIHREDHGRNFEGVALMDVAAPKRSEREDKESYADAQRPKPAMATRESEIRYRRLFEAACDGILILNPVTRKITDANPFMSELLGYPHEELLGKELWEIGLLKDEGASRAAFRELQEKHFIRYEDLPLQTKGGQRRDVEFVSNIYQEDHRDVIQCNVRDITERKRVADALRQAKDQLANQAANLEALVVERTAKLQETVAELQGFSYSVSHDMRAPLRSMQGFAQILVDDYGSKLDERGVSHLQRIVRSAIRLDRLIQDVLSYSSVLHAKGLAEPVDLDGLLRDIIATYPNGHKAEFHIQGKLPTVLGNEAFLTQCFSNLLANASKFVATGTIPRIEIGAEDREPSMVRVWIEDNGIGIAPENHKRIFRMFERINLAAEYEGTGIGLTIVRKAAERMGAKVGFDSELGKGSRFWIQLRKG